MQIYVLLSVLRTFLIVPVGRICLNLDILFLVSTSFIPMKCAFDQVVTLLGEIRGLSLLGLKGFNFFEFIRENKTRETGNIPFLFEILKLTVVKVIKNEHIFG